MMRSGVDVGFLSLKKCDCKRFRTALDEALQIGAPATHSLALLSFRTCDVTKRRYSPQVWLTAQGAELAHEFHDQETVAAAALLTGRV